MAKWKVKREGDTKYEVYDMPDYLVTEMDVLAYFDGTASDAKPMSKSWRVNAGPKLARRASTKRGSIKGRKKKGMAKKRVAYGVYKKLPGWAKSAVSRAAGKKKKSKGGKRRGRGRRRRY